MNHAPHLHASQGANPDATLVRPVAQPVLAGVPTVEMGDAAMDPDWWSESADGRCSESAALFAVSQSAPLTVV